MQSQQAVRPLDFGIKHADPRGIKSDNSKQRQQQASHQGLKSKNFPVAAAAYQQQRNAKQTRQSHNMPCEKRQRVTRQINKEEDEKVDCARPP